MPLKSGTEGRVNDMRLIDADALIAEYTPFIKNAYETNDVLQYTACRNAVFVLKSAPTIDAVPVKRSFWECYETSAFGGYDKDGEVRWLPRKFYRCESCRNGSAIKSNFCPRCGADMRERKDGEG